MNGPATVGALGGPKLDMGMATRDEFVVVQSRGRGGGDGTGIQWAFVKVGMPEFDLKTFK